MLHHSSHRAIVLLSGGLDSAVALAIARGKVQDLETLTIDYGQKAAPRELEMSRRLSSHYRVPHRILRLPWMAEFPSALTSEARPLPTNVHLNCAEETEASARAVWVPYRNGVFISVAAALAEAQGFDSVCVGFNREEGETFPDNSVAFVQAMNDALRLGTQRNVHIWAPLLGYKKVDIFAKALAYNVPLEFVWSCYTGGAAPCGTCESCLRYNRAKAEFPEGKPTSVEQHAHP